MVYVISKNGQPLMPAEDHRKVRLLLQNGKAKVVKRVPFTIQMLGTSHCYTQPITLGVDAGSKHVGMSASTEKKEVFAGELTPRNDVVELLSARREQRASRRNRTTRYRKKRFNNRTHAKHQGWLAPSVEVKIHNHIQGIRLVTRILPVTLIRVETAEFDTQRLKAMEQGNPLPVGTDYQLGEQYDEYNVRQYVLHRDGYTCQCCGKKGGAKRKGGSVVKLQVHHLESRMTGGNMPANLITLCDECHKGYHLGLIELPVKARRIKSMRDAAFMGIMRTTLLERLKQGFPDIEVCSTYGYITKLWRERNNIEKNHINDALCIAKHPTVERAKESYLLVPKREHNRQIHKCSILKGGIRKLSQSPRDMFGYQLFDRVKCNNKDGFIFGRRKSGYFDIRTFAGEKISAGVLYKKLELLETVKTIMVERNAVSSRA